jgi:thymidylate kinase
MGMRKEGKLVDLVVGGPDMSGTSTQIKNMIDFFKKSGLTVRDLRGTEFDALFHAEMFSDINQEYSSISELPKEFKEYFLLKSYELLTGGKRNSDLMVASCIRNNVSTYVNPDSADVWIMEEPTKRGAGQVNRSIEQNRSEYNFPRDPVSEAITHSVYRVDEFFRFRKPLRDKNKIIVRSRSEESACYQIRNPEVFPEGISGDEYFNLPGHKIAFHYAPTNLFIVCGPNDWTEKEYLHLKSQRGQGRRFDDYEINAPFQVMVNNRYASDWVEELYAKGAFMHDGNIPDITRFNIYDSVDEINRQMEKKLSSVLELS